MGNTGIDIKQFLEYVIKPALNYIDLYSLNAEKLLLGTALIESKLIYIDQTSPGPGPAYGLFQMEKQTHDDIWKNYLDRNTLLKNKINNVLSTYPEKYLQLRTNMMYSSIMCRVHYLRVKEKLPDDDITSIGKYWKKYYNTNLGKGSVEKFIDVVNPIFRKIYL